MKSLICYSLIILLIIPSCATRTDINNPSNLPADGFWCGLAHGAIIPFSFIVSLFNNQWAIYSANNTGWAYNLGFIIGLCCWGKLIENTNYQRGFVDGSNTEKQRKRWFGF